MLLSNNSNNDNNNNNNENSNNNPALHLAKLFGTNKRKSKKQESGSYKETVLQEH